MSEENNQAQVENNNVKNDSTQADTNDNYKNVPDNRFNEVIAQKNKALEQANEYKSQLDKFTADAETARQKELEKQGEYKTLLGEANAKIEKLSTVADEYTEYKSNKRETIMKTITDDNDKAIAEGLSLDKLEMFANRVTQTNALGTPSQRPANSKKGTGQFGGYSSYAEWAEKDPEGYQKQNQSPNPLGNFKIGY